MHCNLSPPEPHRPFQPLITTTCQVWSCWTYWLSYYSVFAADTLPVTLRCDLDLWLWTFAVYRLWRDETLYQIWMESSNPRQSFCDFSVCSCDLEHCITHCTRLWDNFHRVWPLTTYPCMNYSVFWYWYVMSLCNLDLDLLTLKVRGTSSGTWSKSVQNLSEIEQFPAELLIILQIICTRYVMPLPWPSTSWPWTFTAFRVSCVLL